jgi:hypothetical protein
MHDACRVHRRLHETQGAFLAALGPRRDAILDRLQQSIHPGYRFPWRVAESPAVIPEEVFAADVSAMRRLLEFFFTEEFRRRYQACVPERYRRPDDLGWFPRFLATDFQRAFDETEGRFTWGVPEAQSFPGNLLLKPMMLQALLPEIGDLGEADPWIGGHGSLEAYVARLGDLVLEGSDPEDAIILELDPSRQATLVDMLLWSRHAGMRIVDLADVTIDASGDVRYRRSLDLFGELPELRTFEPRRTAKRVLCRALPDEMDRAVDQGRLDPDVLGRLFQGTLDRGSAEWVVHPQDFFVVSKQTLVGNPHHHPPLWPVVPGLTEDLAAQGLLPEDGVIKPVSGAGGRGLEGLGGTLDRTRLEALARSKGVGGPQWVWQRRYGADTFAIPSAADDDPRPLYHELRLMWATRPPKDGPDHRVQLEPLTGLVRWSRLGDPANASHQKASYTGTQGILRVQRDAPT